MNIHNGILNVQVTHKRQEQKNERQKESVEKNPPKAYLSPYKSIITLNTNDLNIPIKKHRWENEFKK